MRAWAWAWAWAIAAAIVLVAGVVAWAASDHDDASDVNTEGAATTRPELTTTTTESGGETTTSTEPSTTTEPPPTTTTTTVAPDPFAGRVVLDPDGLNVVDVGTPIDDAVGILNAALGRTPDYQDLTELRYGYLKVRFGLDGIFDCYNAHGNFGENLGLTTREGIGLGSTRTELAAAYGDQVEWLTGSDFVIRFPSGAIGGAADPIENGEIYEIYEIWGGNESCPG